MRMLWRVVSVTHVLGMHMPCGISPRLEITLHAGEAGFHLADMPKSEEWAARKQSGLEGFLLLLCSS